MNIFHLVMPFAHALMLSRRNGKKPKRVINDLNDPFISFSMFHGLSNSATE
jgi:hypothetical protein